MDSSPRSWISRVLAAVATLVVVAVGARLVWMLLEPLLGLLIVAAGLLGILAWLIGRYRW